MLDDRDLRATRELLAVLEAAETFLRVTACTHLPFGSVLTVERAAFAQTEELLAGLAPADDGERDDATDELLHGVVQPRPLDLVDAARQSTATQRMSSGSDEPMDDGPEGVAADTNVLYSEEEDEVASLQSPDLPEHDDDTDETGNRAAVAAAAAEVDYVSYDEPDRAPSYVSYDDDDEAEGDEEELEEEEHFDEASYEGHISYEDDEEAESYTTQPNDDFYDDVEAAESDDAGVEAPAALPAEDDDGDDGYIAWQDGDDDAPEEELAADGDSDEEMLELAFEPDDTDEEPEIEVEEAPEAKETPPLVAGSRFATTDVGGGFDEEDDDEAETQVYSMSEQMRDALEEDTVASTFDFRRFDAENTEPEAGLTLEIGELDDAALELEELDLDDADLVQEEGQIETFDLMPDMGDDEVTHVREVEELELDDEDEGIDELPEDLVAIDGETPRAQQPRVQVPLPTPAGSPRVRIGAQARATPAGLYGRRSVPTIRDTNAPKPRAAAVQLNPGGVPGTGKVLGLEEEEEPIEIGAAEDYGEELDDDLGGGFRLAVQEYEEYEEEVEPEKVVERPPPPPEPVGPTEAEIRALFGQAIAAAEAGDMERGANLYSDVIDGDPDNVDAHVGRGRLYLDLGDYTRAMSDFMVAEDLTPDNPEPQIAIGDLYFARKDYRKAIDYFNAALEMSPNHAMAFCRRGISHYYRKNYKDGLSDLLRAQKLDADIPNIGTYISMAKKKAKR